MNKILITIFLSLYLLGLNAQCLTERHATSDRTAWISCETSPSPNALRGISHWIMYDLQESYNLGASHWWNYNHPGKLAFGLSTVAIDVSSDGINWKEITQFNLEQGSGHTTYEGVEGPDLTGSYGQFVLITALGHTEECAGLSEVRIDVNGLFTSTDNALLNVDISVGPNPASDYIQLHSSKSWTGATRVELISTEGRIVSQQNLHHWNGNTHRIKTSNLSEGMYVVSIVNASYSQTTKISIIHE